MKLLSNDSFEKLNAQIRRAQDLVDQLASSKVERAGLLEEIQRLRARNGEFAAGEQKLIQDQAALEEKHKNLIRRYRELEAKHTAVELELGIMGLEIGERAAVPAKLVLKKVSKR